MVGPSFVNSIFILFISLIGKEKETIIGLGAVHRTKSTSLCVLWTA
jgi:hypothetical protein